MAAPARGPAATGVVGGLLEQVWTQGRVDLIPEFIHADYVLLDERAELRMRGREEFAQDVLTYRALLADITMRATHVVHEGDMVVYRWELIGRLNDIQQLGPGLRIVIRDIPDVGLISVRGINIARLSGGLLIEETCETDVASLGQQMGWWK
ncbi:ester cyclase [Streptomyces sp. NRRL S-920]|uniref:ester cyclase n=1 Tax=Streptomyces sp. NRRL S-920 TaxID=1463921 RepID=UPI0004CBCD5C|nr:ester cyclase [Streptomyces sp. NRRL S-920]